MIARGLFITAHALVRYRERVEDICDDEEVARRLSSDTIVCAARIGARCVRLGGGQRVIIEDGAVVTVLPTGARSPYVPGTPPKVRGRRPEPAAEIELAS